MIKSIRFTLIFSFFILVGAIQTNAQVQNFINQDQSKSLDEIKIFPNPANDYIQISNVVNIKKLVIINIFGKEVKSFLHYNNAQHDVSELKSGMYIVKMLDDKNRIIKTLKFNKNFDGA